MPLPQVPSELITVLVGAVEMLVLVGTLEVVGLEGPVRYQFAGGSPRHSPTVTAWYPDE